MEGIGDSGQPQKLLATVVTEREREKKTEEEVK